MTEQPQSLIEAGKTQAAAAPFLFPDFNESEAYETLESHGEFTGERLYARSPAKYALVVRMIAEGVSTRGIARACAVSANTVEAVRRREGVTVEAEKQELLGMVRSAARLTAERVLELAPSMTARDASVAFGIFTEKMLLLSGDPTVIIGKSDLISHEDFNRLLEALPEADAHVVEPEMGLGAKEGKQNGGAGPAEPSADRPVAATSPPADSAESDEQSLFPQREEAARNALPNASEPDPGSAGSPPGGGGCRFAAPPLPLD